MSDITSLESITAIKKSKGCSVCGGKMVFIRGKYPGYKRRKVCPTCVTERLEQIASIADPAYEQACQAK